MGIHAKGFAAFAVTVVVGLVLALVVGPLFPCVSPPDPAWDPMDPADRLAITNYARGLRYHPAQHPYGERPRLPVVEQNPNTWEPIRGPNGELRYQDGPHGGAQPQVCAHTFTRAELTRGRIIALVDIETPGLTQPAPADTAAGYHKRHRHQDGTKHRHLYFSEGSNYVWIDSLVMDANGQYGKARAVILPTNANYQVRAVQVNYETHGRRNWAEARWKRVPWDDHLWATCAQTGCCTTGDQPYALR